MYYDMSLDIKYNKNELDSLEKSSFLGFCINKYISQRDINKFTEFHLPFKLKNKKLFKKITVNLENHNFNTKSLYNKCDILCLRIFDFDKPVDENMCDVVSYDFTKSVKLKNINPDLYYEINIIDSLYDKRDRLAWMYNVRELIRVTRCKNIVIGTSASHSTELKDPFDIQKMLSIFGLGEDKCQQILDNNRKCLERCAYKRYMSNECVFNDIPEGDLKEKILIKKMGK